MLVALIAAILLANPATAVSWYFLRFWAPSGQRFTSLSGEMVVPRIPRAATYYLWPGLQPTDNTGVYQNVLDGRSGTWWFGSGWCCSNPSLPWGDGFNTYPGETISFQNVLNGNTWTSTTVRQASSATASNNFALASKSFNQAIFAIELYDASWDFGQLEFRNVVITSTGTDSSWCNSSPENYSGATRYYMQGVRASAGGNAVTCTISRLVLQGPA